MNGVPYRRRWLDAKTRSFPSVFTSRFRPICTSALNYRQGRGRLVTPAQHRMLPDLRPPAEDLAVRSLRTAAVPDPETLDVRPDNGSYATKPAFRRSRESLWCRAESRTCVQARHWNWSALKLKRTGHAPPELCSSPLNRFFGVASTSSKGRELGCSS